MKGFVNVLRFEGIFELMLVLCGNVWRLVENGVLGFEMVYGIMQMVGFWFCG